VRRAALGPGEFKWYAVSTALNKPGVEGAALADPITAGQ
jgi:hypothetical protein